MKEDVWDLVKKVGITLAIIIPTIGWIASTVRYRTIVDMLMKSDEKQEERWENQNTINGQFKSLYDHFIKPGSGTEEDPQE